jgi:hypothetical protein
MENEGRSGGGGGGAFRILKWVTFGVLGFAALVFLYWMLFWLGVSLGLWDSGSSV